MNCPDSCTSKHGYHKFRNHGHIQCYPVPLFDMQGIERMGNTANLRIEHLIGKTAHIHFPFPLPDKGSFVASAGNNMPVDTVERSIQFCIGKPAVFMLCFVCFQNLVPAFIPMNKLCGACSPKIIGILKSPLTNSPCFFCTTNPCTGLTMFRR